jgi:copper oxidase (laccase) domain-containing protein
MARLGARRERIVAAVGPCIGPASYEVGAEFHASFTSAEPGFARFFTAPHDAERRCRFDLPAFVLHRLAEAGVASAAWVGRDTCAEPGVLFSNRRALLRGKATTVASSRRSCCRETPLACRRPPLI